jgi:signal transduction histidine kinase
VQVIFRDISERKRADAERQGLLERAEAARAQAEEANRLKEEFLAVLSHELRTPLNAVLGWARVIKKGVSRPEHLTHALTVIERNAAAQVQIIEDLLDVSRIITGRFRLAMGLMDLRQAATNAMESVRPAASAKDLTLNVTLPPEEVVVLGDAVRLQQVAWNLLTNAVKFTEPGGLVNLTVRHLGADAELMVSDTGLGISAEFLPHVFDRFRQQDSSSTRASSGLGLGLSLVRHLVEAHGGRVHASSPGLGSGSTFAVRLPIAGARRALPPDSALDRPASELTATPGAE